MSRRKLYIFSLKKTVFFLIILFFAAALIFAAVILNSRFKTAHYETVLKYSERYNVPKELIFAVILAESSFNENAVSPVGAKGLMQLTDDTFDWLKTQINEDTRDDTDIFDPDTNIKYGTFFLAILREEFVSDQVALCAYNAGRNRAREWLSNKEYSDDGESLKFIPFKETREYSKKVLFYNNVYKYILKIRKG